jgi:hypothetical protein
MVDGDPSKPNFQVKNIGVSEEMALRLGDRFTLLRGIEGVRREGDTNPGDRDDGRALCARAFDMLDQYASPGRVRPVEGAGRDGASGTG